MFQSRCLQLELGPENWSKRGTGCIHGMGRGPFVTPGKIEQVRKEYGTDRGEENGTNKELEVGPFVTEGSRGFRVE